MVITENYENINILNLKGSILQGDCDTIRRHLESYLSETKKFIVVNLLETNHICSSALGQLVYMKNKFNTIGGDIKIIVNDEDLLELLEITMLDQVFQIYEDFNTCKLSFI